MTGYYQVKYVPSADYIFVEPGNYDWSPRDPWAYSFVNSYEPRPYCCPVCAGSGLVSRPPGVPGDQTTWSESERGPYPCKACIGTGILWSPAPVGAETGFGPWTVDYDNGTIRLSAP